MNESNTPGAPAAPLPYKTPLELYSAFLRGEKFTLHYHGKTYDVTDMNLRGGVVFVQPPAMPVKIRPDGSSGEGTCADIWLSAAAGAPAAGTAVPEQQKEPMLVLTGYQLRAAAEFVNPDHGDTDQLESEVCIQWGPARDDGEGGTEPAGLRVWLADYPEEGSMALDPDKPWPPEKQPLGLDHQAAPGGEVAEQQSSVHSAVSTSGGPSGVHRADTLTNAPSAERSDLEAFVRSLLWDLHQECCGRPCVGAEYMGQQEMVCCGCPDQDLLSDAQIVSTLRAKFPEPLKRSDYDKGCGVAPDGAYICNCGSCE